MPQTPFSASWQNSLTLFNAMNGQPCFRVNLSTPLIPLVDPTF